MFFSAGFDSPEILSICVILNNGLRLRTVFINAGYESRFLLHLLYTTTACLCLTVDEMKTSGCRLKVSQEPRLVFMLGSAGI